MALSDYTNILSQYSGASAANAPPQTQADYSRVVPEAPPHVLANGLAQAFRSDQTPPFSQMLSTLFNNSNGEQRAGIVNQLLNAIPPEMRSSLRGLPGVAQHPNVSPAQANQISPQSVRQLAEQAETHDPSVVDRASRFYAQHPTLVQALGAGSLALIMSHFSQQ